MKGYGLVGALFSLPKEKVGRSCKQLRWMRMTISNFPAFPKIGEGGPLAVDEDDHFEFQIPNFEFPRTSSARPYKAKQHRVDKSERRYIPMGN